MGDVETSWKEQRRVYSIRSRTPIIRISSYPSGNLLYVDLGTGPVLIED